MLYIKGVSSIQGVPEGWSLRCDQIRKDTRLQTCVGPADVAADPLRVCPTIFSFWFSDL